MPAAGPEHEVLRVSGKHLVRERTGEASTTASLDLTVASLGEAADFAGVDLDAPFDVGHDTPDVGDRQAPLGVEVASARHLADWFALGWAVLDRTLAGVPAVAEPTVVQLWPEHFDAGCDVAATPDRRVNLGASPGDGFHEGPYLYLGPWADDRPGSAGYWNAPFGAVLPGGELLSSPDPVSAGAAFLREGIDRLV